LVLEGSLDAHMAQVIIRKQEVIEQALNSANAPKAQAQAIARPAAPVFRRGEQGSLF